MDMSQIPNFTVKYNENKWCCLLGQQRRNVDGTKKRTARHRARRDNRLHGKERKAFRSIRKMHAIQYNEDKLKVIGSLFPSNNVDEGAPYYKCWTC